MSNRYRVVLIPPGQHLDPLSNEARLILQDLDTMAVLKRDGTWAKVEEGTAPGKDVGYTFPAGAIEQVAQAFQQYLGAASHAATESAVLREWLAHEQGMLRDLLTSILPPRIVDFGK